MPYNSAFPSFSSYPPENRRRGDSRDGKSLPELFFNRNVNTLLMSKWIQQSRNLMFWRCVCACVLVCTESKKRQVVSAGSLCTQNIEKRMRKSFLSDAGKDQSLSGPSEAHTKHRSFITSYCYHIKIVVLFSPEKTFWLYRLHDDGKNSHNKSTVLHLKVTGSRSPVQQCNVGWAGEQFCPTRWAVGGIIKLSPNYHHSVPYTPWFQHSSGGITVTDK